MVTIGIEPISRASETPILSVELRDLELSEIALRAANVSRFLSFARLSVK